MAIRTVLLSTRRPLTRATSILTCACLLLAPLAAGADERGESRRERGQEREWRTQRRHEDRGPWRFEPRRGWRFERRPGVWSPFYVWWWVDGRAVLGGPPARTVAVYPNGQYELRGDGFRVPYYWVWIPAVAMAPPAPPPTYLPAPESAPPPLAPPAALPAEPGPGKGTAGMVIGGIAGGVLGSTVGRGGGRTAGIIVGTLLGALVGKEIGDSLDDADELRAAHALEKNQTGQPSTWVNPDTGAEVTVVPEKTYQRPSGEYCREYRTEVTVGGERQEAYGTACRQPDGQWKVVE